jgi:hypothetical protein
MPTSSGAKPTANRSVLEEYQNLRLHLKEKNAQVSRGCGEHEVEPAKETSFTTGIKERGSV